MEDRTTASSGSRAPLACSYEGRAEGEGAGRGWGGERVRVRGRARFAWPGGGVGVGRRAAAPPLWSAFLSRPSLSATYPQQEGCQRLHVVLGVLGGRGGGGRDGGGRGGRAGGGAGGGRGRGAGGAGGLWRGKRWGACECEGASPSSSKRGSWACRISVIHWPGALRAGRAPWPPHCAARYTRASTAAAALLSPGQFLLPLLSLFTPRARAGPFVLRTWPRTPVSAETAPRVTRVVVGAVESIILERFGGEGGRGQRKREAEARVKVKGKRASARSHTLSDRRRKSRVPRACTRSSSTRTAHTTCAAAPASRACSGMRRRW